MNENSTHVPAPSTRTPVSPNPIAERESVRTRGGQAGNQNARTHGFYAQHMTARERRIFEAASGLGGTGQETILLRCKLVDMLEAEEPDVALIAKVISLINRLEKDRKITSANGSKGMSPLSRQLATFGARCPNFGKCDRFEEGLRLHREGVDLEELTGGPSPDPFNLATLPETDST